MSRNLFSESGTHERHLTKLPEDRVRQKLVQLLHYVSPHPN